MVTVAAKPVFCSMRRYTAPYIHPLLPTGTGCGRCAAPWFGINLAHHIERHCVAFAAFDRGHQQRQGALVQAPFREQASGQVLEARFTEVGVERSDSDVLRVDGAAEYSGDAQQVGPAGLRDGKIGVSVSDNTELPIQEVTLMPGDALLRRIPPPRAVWV